MTKFKAKLESFNGYICAVDQPNLEVCTSTPAKGVGIVAKWTEITLNHEGRYILPILVSYFISRNGLEELPKGRNELSFLRNDGIFTIDFTVTRPISMA